MALMCLRSQQHQKTSRYIAFTFGLQRMLQIETLQNFVRQAQHNGIICRMSSLKDLSSSYSLARHLVLPALDVQSCTSVTVAMDNSFMPVSAGELA